MTSEQLIKKAMDALNNRQFTKAQILAQLALAAAILEK